MIIKGKHLSINKDASGIFKYISNISEFDRIKPHEIIFVDKFLLKSDGFLNVYKIVRRGAAAIITTVGGKTDHSTVVTVEFGIPRLLIPEDNKTLHKIRNYSGTYVFLEKNCFILGKKNGPRKNPSLLYNNIAIPHTRHKVKINLGFPELIEKYPELVDISDGVGLLRLEFILLRVLDGLHPNLYIKKFGIKKYVNEISNTLERIVLPFAKKNKEVWIRTNDFSPYDLLELQGGDKEILERNPALGYRGIFRSLQEQKTMLIPEILAIKKLVQKGYSNIGIFPPMTRFIKEYIQWKHIIKINRLREVKFGITIETPSVALTFENFIPYIDFALFGSNDLTQFTLALDRSDPRLQPYFQEDAKAVLKLFERVITLSKKNKITTSIGGQAGSNWKILEKLLDFGILETSVSPQPNIVREMKKRIYLKEIKTHKK
ncbi:MAG: hypothetical protein COV00_02945 [Candidatus Tagabacteria bacterium CG10_big_fil_rev_8_21_14_0_10_40_13]|uniref:PEP-utilising enzyme C-terminal domain-containing protein n=1 Tax=Candidatus Tagabacteria bacterium CG10_big_fil_rev_8_21_14_0_10_40_13 TaxID=1975022 RepID=A0A2M8L8C5_9BACT|nr:MAG: hypothetical protein COV00_02945 [Candidatus Tagabacteria bacterium CG10_big_fil_rev_8_21_14_0_10_40_13]